MARTRWHLKQERVKARREKFEAEQRWSTPTYAWWKRLKRRCWYDW